MVEKANLPIRWVGVFAIVQVPKGKQGSVCWKAVKKIASRENCGPPVFLSEMVTGRQGVGGGMAAEANVLVTFVLTCWAGADGLDIGIHRDDASDDLLSRVVSVVGS